MVSNLEGFFPRLRDEGFTITSDVSRDYNCVAWAAGINSQWWWPLPEHDAALWPQSVPQEVTLAAFVALFAILGYSSCEKEELEPGIEKVALFADANGVPTHVARQLPDGRWTSKLGFLEDITHGLRGLVGNVYGDVAQVLKRPRKEP